MWEVMNEEEWNTIYQILRDKNRNIIWVNGKSTDKCDDPQKVQFQLSPDFVHKHKLPLIDLSSAPQVTIVNWSISVQTRGESWQRPARNVAVKPK